MKPKEENGENNEAQQNKKNQNGANVLDLDSIPISQSVVIGNDLYSCTEKSISNLFINYSNPDLSHTMGENSPHKIDFYELGKKDLTYIESNDPIKPYNKKNPYYDFSQKVGKLEKLKTLQKRSDSRVIKYKNEKNSEFVLKRYWGEFDYKTGNLEVMKQIDSFLSEKYSEFTLQQLCAPSGYCINPIDFRFVYLTEQKILVSELLEPYGGKSIESLFGNLTPPEILSILLQLIKALKYLECYHIEHNDIKHDNILVDFVLGKPKIALIDLNIGSNQSITFDYSKGVVIRKGSPIYCSPEIIRNIKMFEDNMCDPRRCQMYSIGILMLFLIKFLPRRVILNDFDSYKFNEENYNSKFYNILDKYYSEEISDPLLKKIVQLTKICVSFSPEKRMLANDLLNLVEKLDEFNLDKIEKQYQETISKISLEEEKKISKSEGQYQAKDDPNFKLEEKLNRINLQTENLKLKNEVNNLKGTNESLSNVNIQLNNIISDLMSKNKGYETKIAEKEKCMNEMKVQSEITHRNHDNLNKEKNDFEEKKKSLFKEKNILDEEIKKLKDVIAKKESQQNDINLKMKRDEFKIEEQNKKNKSLIEENQHLIEEGKNILKKNQELKEIVNEKERALKTSSSKIEELTLYKTSFFENEAKLKGLKAMLKESKIENLAISNSYPDLALNLYYKFNELQAKYSNVQTQYIKDVPFPCFDNAKYTGLVDKDNLPEGAGILIFQDPYRKFIGEFEKGKVKNQLGFMVNGNDSYFFGRIVNGIYQDPTFVMPEYSINFGKKYYLGGTINMERFGFGKEVFADGTFYEGMWEKNQFEGKGKYVFANGNYFEGDHKNGKRDGKGKFVFPNGHYYEGDYKNDKWEGKGKFVCANNNYFEGDYKDNKCEGKGKYVYANGNYYEGDYTDNKLEGKGKYYVLTKQKIDTIYEGNWINGKMEGKFCIINSNNEQFFKYYKENIEI